MITTLGFLLVICNACNLYEPNHSTADEGIFCLCVAFTMFIAPVLDFYLL